MTDLLERLRTALADRYTIERAPRIHADELATPFVKPSYGAGDHGEPQSLFVPGLKPGLGRNWLRQWRDSS